MSINIKGHTGWSSIPNVIGRSRLPHPTVHLLINLLGHAEGFNASYSIIRKQTGMSPGTISTALDNLKKLGLITVEKEKVKGSQFASNDYDFHPENIWKLTPEFVDEKLRGKAPATGNVADKKRDNESDPTTGVVAESTTGVVPDPLQEPYTKNDHLELPVENDHSPAGASDAIASGLPQSDQQSDSGQPAEVATGDDQGKGRHKDFKAFLDAYKSITDLDNQMIGEAARVWHSMFNDGSLPGQEALLEGLRMYWRACKHNERVTGRSVRKRPGNWLRDHMWAADEENLKFQDTVSASAARFVSDDQMLASWGVTTSEPQQALGSDGVVDGEIVEERAQINA